MPPKDDKAAVAVEPEFLAPEPSLKEQLLAAFEARDAAATAPFPDAKAIADAEALVQVLVYKLTDVEHFDPEQEPVMYEIANRAKARQPLAVRLLLQSREQVDLIQRAPNETPMPDEEVGINGLVITVPRGRPVTVPKAFYDILKQSRIR